jgi:hypothetical protein
MVSKQQPESGLNGAREIILAVVPARRFAGTSLLEPSFGRVYTQTELKEEVSGYTGNWPREPRRGIWGEPL